MHVRTSFFFIPGRYLRHLLPVLLLLVIAACRKQDISPEPVGEPVNYNGPAGTIQEALEKSPYAFFKAAWKRADMDTHLGKTGGKAFTLLVPTDKAFQDAGWSLDKIGNTDPASLDSLLSYYVTSQNYDTASLARTIGNVAFITLLQSATVPNYDAGNPYTYQLHIGYHHDSLYVNGLPVSKWGNALQSSTGTIYPIDKMLALPQMDMLTYLQSEERFRFYLEACRINDSLYYDKNPYDNNLWSLLLLTAQPNTGGAFTIFVPTNDAFRKSGFNSVEDLRNYATRSLPIGDPDLNADMYYVYPTTALDSVLLPNRMDFVGPMGPTTGLRDMGAVYYTDELLDNPHISGLTFTLGSLYNLPSHILRLDFTNNNGRLLIKRLGSSATPLPLSTTNVTVYNGVVHVVDEGLYLQ